MESQKGTFTTSNVKGQKKWPQVGAGQAAVEEEEASLNLEDEEETASEEAAL